jgi:hypothetical protein
LVGPQKPEKTVGPAEGPLVLVYIPLSAHFYKDITGKNRAGRLVDYPLTPDIYPPLGKVNGIRYLRVHGP